ncbi:toll/interleukin-1 receptor domain-containing protein [Vibrio anguillarum]|nr:toll/interleukin-1 receptor domain-containing protein [Vibrio anguillarum]
MPIFISYSHENKDFVDKLAIQLVQNNVNVWMDRWELSIGDSIIDKV